MKRIVLLGSTGSVGRNVLDVVRRYPARFRIEALSSFSSAELLARQAKEFRAKRIAIGDEKYYKKAKRLAGGWRVSVSAGEDALCELASAKEADVVFIAISGTAALPPLVAAIRAGKTVALASKEPIVSAGEIVMKMVDKFSAALLPVDSEHNAIMQCMEGVRKEDVERIYITGSGGSLWKMDKKRKCPNVEDVLAHPKWKMGKKITVDSATFMNKGFEVIETRWLFDIPTEKIEVIIHPEAVVHSIVGFNDGTFRASLYSPDMRFPILRALAYPDIVKSGLPRADFAEIGKFTFFELDAKRFPAVEMAFEVLRSGGTSPAVLNAANEAAVKLFLERKIPFSSIIKKTENILAKHKVVMRPSLADIRTAEKWAFEEVVGA